MDIQEWWPKLEPQTREWLPERTQEDTLPPDIFEKIVLASGNVTSEWWVNSDKGPNGFYLSDAASEWIEELPSDTEKDD